MNKKKDNKSRTVRVTQLFFVWPAVLGLMLVLIDIGVFFISAPSGTVMGIFAFIYLLVLALLWFYYKPRLIQSMIAFAEDYAQVQHQLMDEMTLPYALLDDRGNVLWLNLAMQSITGKNKKFHKNINTIFTEIDKSMLYQEEKEFTKKIKFQERDYLVKFKRNAVLQDRIAQSPYEYDMVEIESDEVEEEIPDKINFISMYLFDETDINKYRQQLRDNRMVVGLIYIDNYDEALEGVEDARRSLFIGLVDKRVSKYFTPGAAIVRKLEKDKYLVVFTYQYLEKLMTDKFSLLEDVKSLNIGNEKNITVSIAIGTGAESYADNFDITRGAMDLALGRGGDQAVVKIGDKVQYFGGKSQMTEKNDRVKVRVKAQALRRVLENNQNFLIMGHQRADIDAFGSALGIYIMAKRLKKNVHIVINEITSTVEPFINRFLDNPDYEQDMFYTSQDALEYVDPTTILIVVDVNKAEMTDCPQLLDICRTKIVFDHHRQSSEPIQDTFMSYVDSSASSASEMVTEMLQYVNEGAKLKGLEADALYAGIVIDTNSFNVKSGPRTFEAAAYLRRNGADVNRVRKMLRNDMSEYKAVAQAVSRAEVYRECYAITVFEGEGIKSPTVGGAQAANELLDIRGIKASFVVTRVDDKIFVSARSIDEVNVQLVMERMGGGGHMTVAGAQFTDNTIHNVILTIKHVLDEMIENEDI